MNNITKRTPMLTSLTDLQESLSRLFDPTLIEHQEGFSNLLKSDWIPTIDVKDAGSHFLITADLPGVEQKNLDVSVDNNILTVRGEKETKRKEEKKNYVRVERLKGSFARSISLPELIDENRISAKVKNGVLEVIAPKLKGGSSKRVKIKK